MRAQLTAFILATFTLCFTGGAFAQTAIGFGGVAYDSSQAIEVTADSLSLDQNTGNAVFSGNVLIIQGDLRMAAGEVTVAYAPEGASQQIQSVTATGGVLITRAEDAAEGQNAVYSVSSGQVVLTGDVLVTQGRTAIAGDRLSVDLATGNGTVEGRVRTVLQPSEN